MNNIAIKLNLEDFGLSMRTLCVLDRNKIDRIKLTTITYDELKLLRGIGNEKISEIKHALEAKGYFNINLPSITCASKNDMQKYKEDLLNQLMSLLMTNSNLLIYQNELDTLILNDLKSTYSLLSLKRLENKIKQVELIVKN